MRIPVVVLLALTAAVNAAEKKPNVLLLMSDDLAATLGCYGHPLVKTPHLDSLAAHGVLFERAYCQFPHCNPSRSSLLSGLRPNTTRVTNNEDSLYENVPGVVTLPRLFRQHGYATARCGKIFHLGVPAGDQSMDDPQAWDFGTEFKDERPYPAARESAVKVQTGPRQGLRWTETTGMDDDLVDGNFARTAIEWLEKRDASKPFFLAVGFHRPHLPLVAPAKYFDGYPLESIKLPDAPADDETDIPLPARNGAVPGYTLSTTPEQRRAAIRGYLACVSYVDAQAGRVLEAIRRLGLSDNTIVVFTGDHGWHLGEHGLWHKRSLFEESARVPFLVFAPGVQANGRRCGSLVELLDVYPTLCDLCGIPAPAVLQGKSLRPLLNDVRATLHEAAFTQARRGPNAEHWGRSVRTLRWRCTEWDEGRNGLELYDHHHDPHEYTNLAGDPRHAGVLKELRGVLAQRLPPIAMVDVLIRNGTLIDGTGKPGVTADVAIEAGKIVAVGHLNDMTAKETIDARDRVVCPGFIDLHSHADRGILEFRAAENYIRQGVTTLVCGNCGSSPVNVSKFFTQLRDGGTGPNVALLIGHGSVRNEVIGPLNVPPTPEQLSQMKRLVREAMRAGAAGMSTGLTYSPSAYGTTEEIIELAKEVAPFGGFYATHIRDEGTKVFEAIDEALKIGREAEVPIHISHHKISAASVFGLSRLTLQRIDEARAAGLDVTLDQYPYGAGSGGLSFYVPQSSLSGGLDAYRRRIADPLQRAEIVAGVEDVFIRKLFEAGQSPDNKDHVAAALARVQVARAPQDPKLTGQNLAEILRSRGSEVSVHNGAEVLVDLAGREAVGINHTLDARPGGDVDRVMQHPLTAIASDGSVFEFGKDNPHPRSYGCFPRVLGHYVRERKLLKLEEAIHKMTQLPARRLGWTQRGVIAPGQWADVVVFDPDTVADKATFLEPHQHSVGVEHVLVAGQFVLKSGRMTGGFPGRPLGGSP